MSEPERVTCIYPGCDRDAIAPHPKGGPAPQYCDLEEHNAFTAHQAHERAAASSESSGGEGADSSA